MKDLIFTLELTTTTAADFYIPVPRRGKVVSFRVAHSAETDADELFTLFYGTNALSVCTPTDALAAGTVIDGVMDSTYGETVFDPDSDTVIDTVFHIDNLATLDAGGTLSVFIEFDDSAAQTQNASEA